MSLNYRHYKNYDYNLLCDWLDKHTWPHVPKESVPPCAIFLLDPTTDKEIGVAFIYGIEEGYDFIFPAVMLADPELPNKFLPQIYDEFCEAFEDICRKNNKTHIFLTVESKAIIKRLSTKHGYHIAEKNLTRIVKCLDQDKQEDMAFWYDQEGIDTYFPENTFSTMSMKNKND